MTEQTLEKIRTAHGLPLIKVSKVAYGDGNQWSLTNALAIEGRSDGKLFGIRGPNYRLVSHEAGIAYVEEIATTLENLIGPFTTQVKTFDQGRRMRATIIFPKTEYEVSKNDIVNPTITYRNSYDGKWPELFEFGAYRVICSNGMMIGKKLFQERVIHTGIRPDEKFLESITKAAQSYDEQTKVWKHWTKTEPTKDQTAIALAIFNENQQELIKAELEKAKKAITIWTLYNAMTYVITHRVASLNRQVALDKKVASLSGTWS